ncbi:DUF885 family protein [Pseudoduganella danionis]|uniref:DUF885 domain-containing protein n=1 Tax=Pseudoduganella danionis TaxID=1890295 RepID=UPI0035B31085
MRRIAKWLSLSIVLVLSALVVQTIYFKPLRLDWFYMRVFATFAFDSPELLTGMRILPPWADFFSDKLADASPNHERQMARTVREDLAVLDRYDRSLLDEEEQRSYDTMHFFLQSQVDGEPFLLNDFPVNQNAGIQTALPDFMRQMHAVENAKDAKNYIKRLNHFPLKFEQVISSLQEREAKGIIPPRFTVQKVLAQMRAYIANPPAQHELVLSFKEKLDQISSADMDGPTRARLIEQATSAVQVDVYPAYRKMILYFEGLQLKAIANNGAWSLPNGAAYYAWCVRKHTTTNMTPRQVHALGLSEVERIEAQMDAILRHQGLSEGTVGARLLQLARRPDQMFPDTAAGRQAILVRYQAVLNEVNQRLGDSFDLRPQAGVKVEAVPASSETTAPSAYYKIGAFDNSRPGIFYANLHNPGDVTKFVMRTTAYHEGIPGHHFQMSIAQHLTDVPFFRRILPFTAYNEGWALYAERLAYELGFEQDPLDNLGRLSGEMMRASRLVVDTGIHDQHWTREQAIGYMIDHVGMTDAEATAEVERYFVNPGQALAYQIGMLKILELRERARQALGPKFELKQFHNEVLSHGALPLPVLEQTIDNWIAVRQTPAMH